MPNNKWRATIIVNYFTDEDGRLHKRTKNRDGFDSKAAALAAIPKMWAEINKPSEKRGQTFGAVYEAWLPTHQKSKSTMDCYKAAYKWFEPVRCLKMDDIGIDELQECINDCTKGRRTKENMRALCGLMYKYAIPRGLTLNTLNLAEYLKISADNADERSALPTAYIDAIAAAAEAGSVQYADYVLCQCYLGFRPSELLALQISDYNRKSKLFVGGAKTDAGKNRSVTISPKIQKHIDHLTERKISGAVFCMPDGSPMSISYYRDAFYSVLDALKLDNPTERDSSGQLRHKYTPHSCRHSFATMIKNIDAADKDKLRLIGHTSTEMLRHYQDVNIDDLRRITDMM